MGKFEEGEYEGESGAPHSSTQGVENYSNNKSSHALRTPSLSPLHVVFRSPNLNLSLCRNSFKLSSSIMFIYVLPFSSLFSGREESTAHHKYLAEAGNVSYSLIGSEAGERE